MQRKILFAAAAVALAVTLAYANFFLTGLHSDEYGMVRDNPAIRSLLNLPRFFIDSATTSANPAEYVYEPAVTATLAIDYLLGRGPSPLVLHLDSFLLLLASLGAIASFFHAVFERAIPHPWNPYLAIMGAALVGLHPASAELL